MSNKKILVVEDDIVLRDVLTEKLIQSGYDTTAAADGVEAMEMVQSYQPDLILLDILMPRKGGMEVMEELNANPTFKKIPVIIISNSGQPVEIERARHLGAKDFLIKAVFDPGEVLEKVAGVLSQESSTIHDEVTVEPELDDVLHSMEETAGRVGAPDIEAPIPPVAPVAPEANAVQEELTAEEPVQQSAPDPEEKSSRGSILIVEDDKFLRELFVRKLFSEGFEVDSAIDSDEAFDVLSKKKPDVIFLDLILPGMDGFEILARIKKDDTIKNIPVLVISNLGQKEDIDKAMQLGATDFLVKANFTLDEIIARVLQILHGD